MPKAVLARSFLDKHSASHFASSGKHTAILPIMLLTMQTHAWHSSRRCCKTWAMPCLVGARIRRCNAAVRR
jgi:hypothetical protein